jgi:hypothetical protein
LTSFHFTTYAQDIHFAAGALKRLPEAVAAFGWRRVGLITSGSARRGGRAAEAEALLGAARVFTFDQARAHVPVEQAVEAAALAIEHQAEALVALGGGSVIGLAKAASQRVEQQRAGQPARARFPTDQPLVPVAAIPTTYAGSEMTAIYGVTEPVPGGGSRKVTTADPKVAPKLVIYDPALMLDLPPEITASTGINPGPARPRWPACATSCGPCRAATPTAPTWRRAPRCCWAPTWPAPHWPAPAWGCITACATRWAAQPGCRTAWPTASCCPMPCATTPT